MQVKVQEAKGIYSWFLYKFNYGAITMPWKTIHIRSDRIGLQYKKLLEHELVHVDQINKLGAIKWTLTYFYYQLRYGYANNPFELEATRKSGW